MATHHERRTHVYILGKDMTTFGHIHFEDFPTLNKETDMVAGIYRVAFTFPANGEYFLGFSAITYNDDGEEALIHLEELVEVDTGDENLTMSDFDAFKALNKQNADLINYVRGVPPHNVFRVRERYTHPLTLIEPEHTALKTAKQAYAVKLSTADGKFVVGRDYEFALSYQKKGPCVDGKDVGTTLPCFYRMETLAKYLSAPAHIAVFHEDLQSFLHLHAAAINSESKEADEIIPVIVGDLANGDVEIEFVDAAEIDQEESDEIMSDNIAQQREDEMEAEEEREKDKEAKQVLEKYVEELVEEEKGRADVMEDDEDTNRPYRPDDDDDDGDDDDDDDDDEMQSDSYTENNTKKDDENGIDKDRSNVYIDDADAAADDDDADDAAADDDDADDTADDDDDANDDDDADDDDNDDDDDDSIDAVDAAVIKQLDQDEQKLDQEHAEAVRVGDNEKAESLEEEKIDIENSKGTAGIFSGLIEEAEEKEKEFEGDTEDNGTEEGDTVESLDEDGNSLGHMGEINGKLHVDKATEEVKINAAQVEGDDGDTVDDEGNIIDDADDSETGAESAEEVEEEVVAEKKDKGDDDGTVDDEGNIIDDADDSETGVESAEEVEEEVVVENKEKLEEDKTEQQQAAEHVLEEETELKAIEKAETQHEEKEQAVQKQEETIKEELTADKNKAAEAEAELKKMAEEVQEAEDADPMNKSEVAAERGDADTKTTEGETVAGSDDTVDTEVLAEEMGDSVDDVQVQLEVEKKKEKALEDKLELLETKDNKSRSIKAGKIKGEAQRTAGSVVRQKRHQGHVHVNEEVAYLSTIIPQSTVDHKDATPLDTSELKFSVKFTKPGYHKVVVLAKDGEDDSLIAAHYLVKVLEE
ncbi:hypothetical protein SARC_09475 [Sphaeroforma arctica JP610]|uniref:Uncharacterized protein n=1 Tax=Sphaeroforma arctica JP610 TaxID=667725 RepID=A0A0L0FMU8_9EUKA|nr:hypothetical protein SARC_09475 [Sphaeroforma arctica JP610]KNC78080.1 hypothetical protein SARC_09475 [Sphaeroforma arctica JP610]|eukprot:XP_014151982.1 hypothetical protein SARC_09475 [Sphaeroforma arctica JP610]